MKCQRRTDTTFGNSVVARREMMQNQQGHRQRISEIKSTLDTRPPAAQPHLTLYGRDYVSKKKATTEAAFSDLKMIQAIARTMTRKQHSTERKGPISLNADARKQEIYNIMHANHRLLENIESVNPVMRTKDLVKDHRDKIRYVINSSHTMRLSGEYDTEIDRIRKEDRDRFEATQRSTRMRMDASQRLRGANGGSVSLPSLTGTTRSDPGAGSAAAPLQRSPSESRATSSAAQPAQGSRRPAQRTPSRGPQATGAAQDPSEKSDASAAVAAKPSVHFSGAVGKGSPKQKSKRESTPHPTKYTPEFDGPEKEANDPGTDAAGTEPSAASRAAPEAPEAPATASALPEEPPATQPGSPPAAAPAAASEAPPAAKAPPGPQGGEAAAAAAAAEEAPPLPERAEPEGAAEAEVPAAKAAAEDGAAAAAEPWGAAAAAGGAAAEAAPAEAAAGAEAPAGGTEGPEAATGVEEVAEGAGGGGEEEPPVEAAPEWREEAEVPEQAAGAEEAAANEAAAGLDEAEASFPEKQESRMEEDYEEDYENEYEDDFADESLNASRAQKGHGQGHKETLDALDESATFEDSHG